MTNPTQERSRSKSWTRCRRLERQRPLWAVVVLTSLMLAAILLPALGQSIDPDRLGLLWVGAAEGTLKITLSDGSTELQIADPLGVTAVEIDEERRVLWVYAQPDLHAFGFGGQPLFTVSIPSAGAKAELELKGSDGSVWLAVDSDLFHVDAAGQLIASFSIPDTVVGIAPHYIGDLVAVATPSRLAVHDGVSGAEVSVADLGNGKTDLTAIRASHNSSLSFQPTGIWIVNGRKVQLIIFFDDGTLTLTDTFDIPGVLALESPAPLLSQYPVWAITSDEVYRLDARSVQAVGSLPFAGESVAAMAAQWDRQTLWLASGAQLHHFGVQQVNGVETVVLLETIDVTPPAEVRDLVAFGRDRVPPDLSVVSPAFDSWVSDPRLFVQVTYGDSGPLPGETGTGVDPDTLTFSQGASQPPLGATCTHFQGGSDCQLDDPVGEGIQGLVVEVADFAGNPDSVSWRVLVDSAPPTISFVTPLDGATLTMPRPDLEVAYGDPVGGSGLDTSTLAFTVGGQPLAVDCTPSASSATCTPLKDLPGGAVALGASVADVAGGTGTAQVSVTVETVDTTPPDLVIASPSAGELVVDPTPEVVLDYQDGFTGIDTATLAVEANGSPLAVTCSQEGDTRLGSLRCLPAAPLAVGPVSLSAVIADAAGNVSAPAAASFTLLPPETTVTGAVQLADGTPAAGATVTVQPQGDSTLTAADGTFSLPGVDVTSGELFEVIARVASGSETLAAAALGLFPTADGSTDAGVLTLEPLCPLYSEGLTGLGGEFSTAIVSALESFDDGTGPALYVGGNFEWNADLGGQFAVIRDVARWDGGGWEPVGQGIAAFSVLDFEVHDDGTGAQLYAGVSGTDPVVRWDGSTWEPVGPGTIGNTSTSELEVFDDGTGPALYAAGNSVERWDGQAWTTISGPLEVEARSLEVFDPGTGPRLFAGGSYVDATGTEVDALLSWDGSAWTVEVEGWLPYALAVFDDGTGPTLYVGGDDDLGGGYGRLGRWNGAGIVHVATTPGVVEALAVHDDGAGAALYAVGQAGGLVRWDGQTASVLASAFDVQGAWIRELLTVREEGTGFPDALYFGGRFSELDGRPASSVGKWFRTCDPSDRTPPKIALASPANGLVTTATEVTLTGSLDEPAVLTIDGASVALDAALGFSHGPLPLLDGGNSFELVATDPAGNETKVVVQVARDGEAPSVQVAQPGDGATVPEARPVIEVIHRDAVGIDPGSLALDAGGAPLAVSCESFLDRSRCRPVADLAAGPVTLTATVRDLAGNPSVSAPVSFTVDPSAGPQTTTVSGVVTLVAGTPVAGAAVAILGQRDRETSTASDGSFSVPGVDATSPSLTVVARLPGGGQTLIGVGSGIAPIPGGITDAGTLVLRPACDLAVDPAFLTGVGVDGDYPKEDPGGFDLRIVPQVRALAVYDDGSGPALYVAGNFKVAGGVAANNVARWDGETWSAVGNQTRGGGVDSYVQDLIVFDDDPGDAVPPKLYAAGFFGKADGSLADRVAAWDGTAWSGLGVSFSGYPGDTGVYDLEIWDDGGGPALYAGGRFTGVDGVATDNLARWDGTAWSGVGDGLGNGLNHSVFALEVYSGKGNSTALYAGGDFTENKDGTVVRRIAAWDGSSWSDVDGGVDVGDPGLSLVASLREFGGDLFVGGYFGTVGSAQELVGSIARWDGRSWSGAGELDVIGTSLPREPMGVQALEVFDDGSGAALFALGSFGVGSGGPRTIARWTGQDWASVGSGLGGSGTRWGGHALASFDPDPGDGTPPQLYAGGPLTREESQGRGINAIASWDGTEWSPVNGGVADEVLALAVFDDGEGEALYVSGSFGMADKKIVRWDGSSWLHLPFSIDGETFVLAPLDDGSGPALYAGGRFTNVGPWAASGVARWNGVSWEPLGDDFDLDSSSAAGVRDLAVYDDGTGPALYATGSFDVTESRYGRGVARWDGSAWNPLGSGIGGSGQPRALAVHDDGTGPALYVGGDFPSAGRALAPHVARWDGVEWSTVGGELDGPVLDLAVFDAGTGPALYATGSFTRAGGQTVNHVARWDGASWQPLGTGLGAPGVALAVVDAGDGPALYAAGQFDEAGGVPAHRVAKWDGQTWSSAGSDLDVRNLSLGTVKALTGFDDGTGPALYLGGAFAHGETGRTVKLGYFFSAGEIDYLARVSHPLECGGGDTVPPTVAFTAPEDGSAVLTDLPELRLSYSDSGSGVDTSSLVVESGGSPLGIDCTFGAFSAVCTLQAPLPEGPVSLTATVADAAGNVSAPAGVTFAVVTGAPLLSFTAPAEGEIVGTTAPGVTLDYTANADPSTLNLSSSPSAVGFTCTTGPTSAACTPDAPLPEGASTLTATVASGAGEVSDPAAVTFVVDTAPPTLSITAPGEGETVTTGSPTMEIAFSDAGSGVDPSSLALDLDGAPLAASCTFDAAGATCTPASALADGSHTLSATVADLSGKLSAPDSVGFTVDTTDRTAPVITVVSPVSGSLTKEEATTFRGSLDEPATLTLDGEAVTVAGDLTFNHPRTLEEGFRDYVLVATDPAGNSSTSTVTVLLDTTAPALSFLVPTDLTFFDPTAGPVEIRWGDSGSGIDPSTFELRADGVALAADCTYCDTGASCDLTAPPEGRLIELEARVQDAVRNPTAVARVSFTPDPTADVRPPEITLSSPRDGDVTGRSDVRFVGLVSEPATLTLDGAPVALDSTGVFDYGPVPLVEGANAFSLVATDASGNPGQVDLSVTRDSLAPAPVDPALVSLGEAVDGMVSVLGAAGAVSPVEPGMMVVVTNSATTAEARGTPASDGSFGVTVPGRNGHDLTVATADTVGNRSVPVVLTVPGVDVPPADPAATAPALDRSVITDLCAATAFLYTGAGALQSGVLPGTLDCRRVALVKGRVVDRSGLPVPGVTVAVHGHPELGTTATRADGAFDLVVHGGAPAVLTYSEPGLLPVQRRVRVGWNRTTRVPDVVMIPLDAQANLVDLGSPAAVQVARGSTVTDSDGTRQATLLFFQGMSAALRFPGGTTQPVGSLTVRATEYTVGPEGPDAMPAELPAGTAYTYAVELSADEVRDAGAASLEFSQPVVVHLENFLALPTGTVVPAGYYDRAAARWVAAPNGLVITVLDVSSGVAELDVDGSGLAADAATLSSLGITDDERQELAALYPAGQSLWRVPVDHFTSWDFNFPAGLPPAAEAPGEPAPKGGDADKTPRPCEDDGSIIECQNQVLGERLGVPGTPFTLNYRSDRVPGRVAARTLEVPLSGASLPPEAKRIELELDVAGQEIVQSFPATVDQSATVTWNGSDGYGRTVQGRQPYQARVGYVYDAVYENPPDGCATCFGEEGSGAVTGDPARQEATLWQTHGGKLGSWDARSLALGGWSLDAHHAYDPDDEILYRGDGTWRHADGLRIATVIASSGTPTDLAVHADGTVDYLDVVGRRVLRLTPEGLLSVVAGATGPEAGPAAEGSRADQVFFQGLRDVAVGPDDLLYVLDAGSPDDQGDSHVWRVDDAGTLVDVLEGVVPDGDPATGGGYVIDPTEMVFGPFGDLYIADDVVLSPLEEGDEFGKSIVIWRVNPVARIVSGYVIGMPMLTTSFDLIFRNKGPLPPDFGTAFPQAAVGGMAFGPNGDFFFSVNSQVSSVWRRYSDGFVELYAGSCLGSETFTCSGYNGDGIHAADAYLDFPEGLSVDVDGTVVLADAGNGRVRSIEPFGRIISTLRWVGADLPGPTFPSDVERAPDDCLVVSDSGSGEVQSVCAPSPVKGVSQIRVPSENGGRVFVFDGQGRHQSTETADTGETLLSFGYTAFDERQLLTSISDAFGNVTTIERDALTGGPVAIVAPFGQRAELTLDANGYLATVTNPASETVELTYTPDGLLTRLTDPKLGETTFQYDALGRLEKDQDPVGGFTQVSRTELAASGTVASGFEVTKSTALGRTTVYRTEELTSPETRLTVTDPSGLATVTLRGSDGSRTTTSPDGTVVAVTEGPDPRFDMLAPRLEALTISTPGGLNSTTTTSRSATLVDPAGDPQDPANVASVTDTVTVNGRTATSVRDFVARQVTATTPEGRQSTTRFDVYGRSTQVQVPGLAAVQYGYDARGRLGTVTQGTRTTTYGYDPATGYLSTVTDPASRQVSFSYDAAGRVASQTLPDSRVIAFAYDANGNLTSITPPGRPAHGFVYTPDDQPETYTPPDVGLAQHATTLAYNLDGQVELVTRPDGRTVDPVYDPTTGRLASVVTPRGTTSYGYDPTSGNLSTVIDPTGGSISYGYDGALPTSVTWAGAVAGSVGFGYDDDFELVSRTVNGAHAVSFGYDQDGLMTSAGALTLTRDPASGFLSGTTLGSLADAYSYDSTYGEPASYTASHGGSELYAVDYTVRDELGRIEQKVETVGAVTTTYDYSYDLAGRLTDVYEDGLNVAHYDYDANSNRTAWADPWGSGTATYDDQDRLTSYGGATYTYTANGELATKTAGAQTVTYDYDVQGNLRQVVLPDGLTIDYVIDAANRRIGKKVDGVLSQGFLYRGQLNPVAELDGSGAVVSTFVYASRPNVPDYLVKAGTTYRVISDHLGSVRLVVDATDGTIAQRLDYDAFGRVMLDTNPGFQPFGFAGGLYDPQTGLVRFGARDYDPETGRWTAKDPIGFSGGQTNLYGYVVADPVNLVDPDGQIGLLAAVGIGAAAGAVIGGGWYLAEVLFTDTTFRWAGLGGATAQGAVIGGLGVAAAVGVASLGVAPPVAMAAAAALRGGIGTLAGQVRAWIDECYDFDPGASFVSGAVLGGLKQRGWTPPFSLVPSTGLTVRSASSTNLRYVAGDRNLHEAAKTTPTMLFNRSAINWWLDPLAEWIVGVE